MGFMERAGMAQRGMALKNRWDRLGRELASLVGDDRRVEELGSGAREVLQSGRRALGELRAGVRRAEASASPATMGTLRELRALLEETERLLQDLESRLPAGL